MKDCKKRHTNLSMAWIDYKKVYDFVPHSWINTCMDLFGIAHNMGNFLEKSMEQWKFSLTTNSEDLGEVDVKRGIIQGESFREFVLSMVPLSLILRKVNASYEWGKKEYKLNHLLLIDDFQEWRTNEYTCENCSFF